jgi:hypothetical protein
MFQGELDKAGRGVPGVSDCRDNNGREDDSRHDAPEHGKAVFALRLSNGVLRV